VIKLVSKNIPHIAIFAEQHMKAYNRMHHDHDHPRFRFVPVSVRGGMQQYQNAIKEEKLLSSKKVMSFLQRR